MDTLTQPADQLMSRTEVASVLAIVAHYRGTPPSEADVRAWRHALAGYTVGECQAAVLAAAKTTNNITPAEVIGRIKTARRVTEARTPRRRTSENDRALFAAAARRGMAAVYAETGWTRTDDAVVRDALSRICPACGALPGITCRRVTRIRNGVRETRELRSRAHPSRLSTTDSSTADSSAAAASGATA